MHGRTVGRPPAVGARTRPTAFAAGATVAVAVLILVLATSGVSHGYVSGDTRTLVRGSRQVVACLRDGDLTRCGTQTSDSTIGPFPALQYLAGVPMAWLDLDDETMVRSLKQLNLVAFAGLLLLCGRGLRPRLGARRTAVVQIVVVGGPLVAYSTASFGEMLTTLAVTAFVVAALARRPVLLGATLAVACLGKETLPPFLVVFGVLAVREPGDGWLPARRFVVPLVAGAAVGFAMNTAFNLFRFASATNTHYLDPLFRMPGLGRRLRFAVGMWVAPNAGLLWFWTSAALVLAVFLVVAVRRRRDPWPFVLLAAMAVFIAGLASFVAPFGWLAYGPRLVIPLVPAFVVLALHLGGDRITAALHAAVRTAPRAAAVCVVLGVAVVPAVSAVWHAEPAVLAEIAPDESCPETKIVQDDAATYYRCLENSTWRLHSMVLPAAVDLGDGPTLVATIAVVAAVTLLVLHARAAELPSARG